VHADVRDLSLTGGMCGESADLSSGTGHIIPQQDISDVAVGDVTKVDMSNCDKTICSESRDCDCSACDIVVVACETEVEGDDKIEVDSTWSACGIVGVACELNVDDDDDDEDAESHKIEVLSSDWGGECIVGDCMKLVDTVDTDDIVSSCNDNSNVDNYCDVCTQSDTCVYDECEETDARMNESNPRSVGDNESEKHVDKHNEIVLTCCMRNNTLTNCYEVNDVTDGWTSDSSPGTVECGDCVKHVIDTDVSTGFGLSAQAANSAEIGDNEETDARCSMWHVSDGAIGVKATVKLKGGSDTDLRSREVDSRPPRAAVNIVCVGLTTGNENRSRSTDERWTRATTFCDGILTYLITVIEDCKSGRMARDWLRL